MCCQCANANIPASPMKISTTDTLIMTAALLKLADSRTPTTRIAVMTTMSVQRKDVDLRVQAYARRSVKRDARRRIERQLTPKKPTRLLTNPLQPTATVAAPKCVLQIPAPSR